MRPLDVLGPGEVAKLLGVNDATVWRWRQAHLLPRADAELKIGPVWRLSTITRWAELTGRQLGG